MGAEGEGKTPRGSLSGEGSEKCDLVPEGECPPSGSFSQSEAEMCTVRMGLSWQRHRKRKGLLSFTKKTAWVERGFTEGTHGRQSWPGLLSPS